MICWGEFAGYDQTGNLFIDMVPFSPKRWRVMIYIGGKLITWINCYSKTLDEMRDIGIDKVENILKQIHKQP